MALVIAGLVSLNTWRSVRDQERDLMLEFEREFATERVSSKLLTQEERALAQAEADLEGEVERLRVDATRKNAPKPVKAPKEKKEKPAKAASSAASPASRLKLSFGKKKEEKTDAESAVPPETAPRTDEDPDAKRARLLALKAEIERKKGEQQ
jgi:hypothetical protein